jgi:hypothetical protein
MWSNPFAKSGYAFALTFAKSRLHVFIYPVLSAKGFNNPSFSIRIQFCQPRFRSIRGFTVVASCTILGFKESAVIHFIPVLPTAYCKYPLFFVTGYDIRWFQVLVILYFYPI